MPAFFCLYPAAKENEFCHARDLSLWVVYPSEGRDPGPSFPTSLSGRTTWGPARLTLSSGKIRGSAGLFSPFLLWASSCFSENAAVMNVTDGMNLETRPRWESPKVEGEEGKDPETRFHGAKRVQVWFCLELYRSPPCAHPSCLCLLPTPSRLPQPCLLPGPFYL